MIFRSLYPDVEIPTATAPEYVLGRVRERADRPALIDGPTGRVLTYGEVDDGARRVAAGLRARGIGRGDVVVFHLPNVPEWAPLFLGALLAGAAVSGSNPLSPADDLARQLQMSRAKLLVTVTPLLDAAGEAARRVGIDTIVLADGGGPPLAALVATEPIDAPAELDPAHDLAALPFSSGTSGRPKGVMLTHRNLVAVLEQVQALYHYGENSVTVGVLPFFHIFGLQVLLNLVLRSGATCVTMPRFDLQLFLDVIEQHRVTHLSIVPPIALALATHPAAAEHDLSSIEAVLCGAAPLDAVLQERLSDRLGVPVVQGYGMTETSLAIAVCPMGKTSPPGVAGQLIPNVEARVVDVATGEERGVDEEGELCVRGPNIMEGYLDDPEATAATIEPDGWMHTGDVTRIDADGYISVVDRVKELIKYKGYQVAPAELEGLLLTHAAVADVAVIPSPDPEAGEVPKAFVVLREEVEPDEIVAFVAERVAPYKRVRRIEVVEEIPKSPTGKILRRVLVDRERGAH